MKRYLIALLTLSMLIIGCSSNKPDNTTNVTVSTKDQAEPEVKLATSYHLFSQENDASAELTFNHANKRFTFSFDPLSSYLAYGDYVIQDDMLTTTTDDGRYTYRFRIVDNAYLQFVQNGSDYISLIDNRIGNKIVNGSILEASPETSEPFGDLSLN